MRLLLRKNGSDASLTTNSIAVAAGVSIGSVYQYFPNKQAIYRALLDSHLVDMQGIIERRLLENRGAAFEVRVRALVEAIVSEHARDADLYDLLFSQTTERTCADIAHEERVRDAFRIAICESRSESAHELDQTLFVLVNMIESLTHGAVLRRPPHLSLDAATEAAVGAVLAYLRA
ncbi:MAG: TetR/AcrR family transcriptional regulator [Polyangiaceae bacterium]